MASRTYFFLGWNIRTFLFVAGTLPGIWMKLWDFFTVLRFFLEKDECMFVYNKGMAFLQSYTYLAKEMFRAGRWHLYPLYPKIHAVHHIWVGIFEDGQTNDYSINPLTASCQQDEDAVGRVSRTSRRVNVRKVCLRTLQRHLMSCYKVWKDAKLIM